MGNTRNTAAITRINVQTRGLFHPGIITVSKGSLKCFTSSHGNEGGVNFSHAQHITWRSCGMQLLQSAVAAGLNPVLKCMKMPREPFLIAKAHVA